MMSEEATEQVVQEGAQEQVTAPEGQIGDSAEYDRGDYISRVRNEPDFAAEQVREKDRKINELNQSMKRLGALDPYVTAAGGVDELLAYINAGNTVLSNQQIKQFVEEYARTGQLPTAAPQQQGQEDDDDPYADPEVKSLKQQVRELKASLEQLGGQYNQRFAQAETRSMQAGIEKNIGSLMDLYAVDDTVRQKLSDVIESQVKRAEKAAESGDSDALRILSQLHGATGIDVLKRMAAPVLLEPEVMRAIALSKESSQAGRVAAQSTGTPARTQSANGKPSMPDQKLPIHEYVRQVLERNTKAANRDPGSLWGNQ